MKIAELVEQAYLAGYRHGLEAYSYWSDSQRLVGKGLRLSDALKNATTDCLDAYSRWIQSQQIRHDGVEKPVVVERDKK